MTVGRALPALLGLSACLGLAAPGRGQDAPAPVPAAAPATTCYAYRIGEVPVGTVEVRRETLADGGTRTEIRVAHRAFRNGADEPFAAVRTVEETADGEVRRLAEQIETTQGKVSLEGAPSGGRCHFAIAKDGGKPEPREIPWPGETLGPAGVDRLRVAKGFAPGTSYRYLAWAFDRGDVVSWEATVEGEDALPHPQGPAKAVRLAVRPLAPAGGAWLEWWTEGRCVRRWDGPGGGTSWLALPPEIANARGSGVVATWAVDRVARVREGAPLLLRPAEITEATYRLRIREGEWGTPLLDGGDQDAKRADDGSWLVRVSAGKVPAGKTLPLAAPAGAERTLAASYYVEIDDPGVRVFADGALAGEKDAARAVRKIAAAVRARLRPNGINSGLATAAEALRQGEGDPTEQAVLFCAAARLAGLPVRLAGGLWYRSHDFTYHAWPEVWAGKWIAVDPTRPDGRADAARIRFAAIDLGEGTPEDALVAVGFLVDRLEIEILEAKQGALRLASGVSTTKTSGNACEDPVAGIRLALPQGWTFTDPPPGIAQALTVARGQRGRQINVRAGPATYPQTLDDVWRDTCASFTATNIERRTVDGRPAIGGDLSPRGGGGGYAPRTVFVLDGGTLFCIEYGGQAADGLAAFDALLRGWRFVGPGARGGSR